MQDFYGYFRLKDNSIIWIVDCEACESYTFQIAISYRKNMNQ